MGTRNMTLVVKDGVRKVAQYCQWDGYPTGQGADICRFLQEDLDLRKFKKALDECKFVDEKVIHERWMECGADGSGFVDSEISGKFLKKFPQFHRDTGADILKLIQDEEVRELQDAYPEEGDGTWIEYSYIVDVDKKKLFVYRGMVDLKDPEAGLWKSYSFKSATPKAMSVLENGEGEED